MKKKIKIDFIDFWCGYDKTDNYFYNLLKEEFDVEISNNPDYLFFSVLGYNHQKYNCKKIFYTGENIAPKFENCDYSFSFEPTTGTNYRLPHYLLYDGYYELALEKKIDESMTNRKFCNFVVTNGRCNERNNFYVKLSKYKKVDSGGSFANNIGHPVHDKIKFQSEYKFSIAFENNFHRPGYEWYITEKIMDPMIANSIPLYRGGVKICEDFNTESFINFHNFHSEDDMIDYIIELDKDDSRYLKMLNKTWFNNNQIPDNNKIENIKSFLYKIFE